MVFLDPKMPQVHPKMQFVFGHLHRAFCGLSDPTQSLFVVAKTQTLQGKIQTILKMEPESGRSAWRSLQQTPRT